MNHLARHFTALSLLALACTLVACNPAPQSPGPAPASAPATPPASPPGTPPRNAVALDCNDASATPAGEYIAENNAWGKGSYTGWTQCMGATALPGGGVSAHWRWDWKDFSDQVKAYPEVIYGHKPGYPKSSTTALPRPLKALRTVGLSYTLETERQGAGNLAIDMWLTSTDNPTTFAVPPITHEVMIWLEVFGPMYAGGQQVDEVRINGTLYRVYVGEKFGLGWRYIAFTPNAPMQTSAHIDLMPFFSYLQGKQLVTADAHLAAINFGNELIGGQGETRLKSLQVTAR